MKPKDTAYDEGYNAYINWTDQINNPYPLNSDEEGAWDAGWWSAYYDDQMGMVT